MRIEPDLNGTMGEMKLVGINEIGRFPEVPYPAVVSSAGYRRAPSVVAAHEDAVASLQREIRRRLAKTEPKGGPRLRSWLQQFIRGRGKCDGEHLPPPRGGFRLRLADVAGRRVARRFHGLQRRPRLWRVRRRRHAEGDPRDRPDRGRAAESTYYRPQPRHRRAGVGFSATERGGLCFRAFRTPRI